jgi:cellulose biosynthesis protein BcsQ
MHFGEKVFRTVVPRNVRLAEAPSFGKPVLQHDKDSRGALAYLALAGEMLRRDDAVGALNTIGSLGSAGNLGSAGTPP